MADVYFLIEYPIYREFDADDIDVLSGICTEQSYPKGRDIFREADPGDAMYIIKKGTVKIYKEDKNRKKFIAMLSEGEFFGEMALIDGSPRSASALAGDTGCELVKLSTDGLKKLKTDHAKTGFKVTDVLLKFMSFRIRRTTQKTASLLKGRKKKIKKPAKKKKGGKK